jgi:hypothetical protein
MPGTAFRAMDFPYPRLQFGIRFCIMMCLLAAMLFLLARPDIDRTWLAFFGIVFFIATVLTTLTPMATGHEAGDGAIVLRQGLLFRESIPYGDIQSVQRLETRLWAWGLFPAGAWNRIVLASGSRNLVEIKLKEKRRFGMLLWRSSKEIIIDLDRPDDFVKMVTEKLLG